MPLFYDADGYTFRRPGIHRIQATFRVTRHHELVSNAITINVRTQSAMDQHCEIARRHLAQPRSSMVLQHRQDLSGQRGIRLLSTWLGTYARNDPLAASVRYAVGRARLMHVAGKHVPWPSKTRRQGRDDLKRALDTGHLSRHEERIAVACLDTE